MFIYLLSTFKLTAHKKGDIKNDHDRRDPRANAEAAVAVRGRVLICISPLYIFHGSTVATPTHFMVTELAKTKL